MPDAIFKTVFSLEDFTQKKGSQKNSSKSMLLYGHLR